MKTKIVVTNPMSFSVQQQLRLERLGDVTFYDTHDNETPGQIRKHR